MQKEFQKREEIFNQLKTDKQEAIHSKKQKDKSKKYGKYKVRKVLITSILAGIVAFGILYVMPTIPEISIFIMNSIILKTQLEVDEIMLVLCVLVAVTSFVIVCFMLNRLNNRRFFWKERSGNNKISDSAIRTMTSFAKQMIEMITEGDQVEEILNILPELNQSREIIESAIDTWKMDIKEYYGTYKQVFEQNVTVNKHNVTVTSNCEFENGEVIITFEFKETFCMTKVEFSFTPCKSSGIC